MSERTIIRIFEAFSGEHSWSLPYKTLDPSIYDVRVFSIDNNPKYSSHTTVIKDILNLNPEEVIKYLEGVPDVFYASPLCTSFSIASCSTHWSPPPNREPKSDVALLGLALLKKTLELIDHFNNLNSDMKYFIENPRGLMRKMPCMKSLNRSTVWYCKYGDVYGGKKLIKRAKPTDIWHNSSWQPLPVCKNHTFVDGVITSTHCDHVVARRGAKTGTQGLKGNAERSLIPDELTKAIFEVVIK